MERKSLINRTPSVFLLAPVVLILASQQAALAQTNNNDGGATCELNGVTFQRGESLGASFATRCGSATEYPCFCNPDLSLQVECPYCGFALEGGGLLCGKDLEVHSFRDIDGLSKTCECFAPMGGPSPTFDCDMEQGEVDNEPATSPPAGEEGSSVSCSFDLPDGTSVSFLSGEPISAVFNNRCGDDFPCYCDPTVEGQFSCPYCRFPEIGGDMFCARDGQAVSFQDENGVNQMCSCTVDGNGEPTSTCNATGGNAPTAPPENNQSGPPTVDQSDVCTLELDDGNQVITFQNGESFGDYFSTRCGSSNEFPCFCNTELPNNIDCPYCGFVTEDGELICAKNDETVGFLDVDTYRTCSCEIVGPGQEPIRTCEDGDIPPTAAPTETISENPTNSDNECVTTGRNGEIVVAQNGESFGDLIDPGVCGSTEEWPAFCNLALVDTISRQGGSSGGMGTIEYPYCIFENTLSGIPVCAKSNGRVTYVDDSGVTQRCSCTYLIPSLGGAQSSCTPDEIDSAPTASPVEQATSSPTLRSSTIPPPSSAAAQQGGILLAVSFLLLGPLAILL